MLVYSLSIALLDDSSGTLMIILIVLQLNLVKLMGIMSYTNCCSKLFEKVKGCLAGLLMRGSKVGAGAILVAPPKRLRLLCFSLKNGSSYKTFGRAPAEAGAGAIAKAQPNST